MSESLIREIAASIFREQLLVNWRFYAILLATAVLAAACSTFMVAYVRKRADSYATRADLADLVSQLQATTKAAEEVKVAISHADWSTREWKSLRRTKLEELLSSVYDIRHWLDVDMNVRFFNESKVDMKSPIWRFEVISRLYFPELHAETQALSLIYIQYTQWMMGIQQKLYQAGNDAALRDLAFRSMRDDIQTQHAALLGAVARIEAKAPQVLQAIVVA